MPYQWVCRRPVEPVEVVEINVDDHLHLVRYADDDERERVMRAFAWDGD